MRRIAPWIAASIDRNRFSKMYGYGSKPCRPFEPNRWNALFAITHVARNSPNAPTNAHDPIPFRIASAARSPVVSSSPAGTAGCRPHSARKG